MQQSNFVAAEAVYRYRNRYKKHSNVGFLTVNSINRGLLVARCFVVYQMWVDMGRSVLTYIIQY